jgi:hypothetical protein
MLWRGMGIEGRARTITYASTRSRLPNQHLRLHLFDSTAGHDQCAVASMSSQVSAEKLGDAILQSAKHGAFPQDDDVASASVPSTALPKLLEVVGKAKEDTKVDGCNHLPGAN